MGQGRVRPLPRCIKMPCPAIERINEIAFQNIKVPADGEKVRLVNGKLEAPANPIICYIEGDGTGVDIWAASMRLLDAAVEKAYKGERKIHWMEVYAGEKSWEMHDRKPEGWLPQETLDPLTSTLLPSKAR